MQKKTKQFYYKKHGSFFKYCDVHMFFVEEIIVSSITIRFLYFSVLTHSSVLNTIYYSVSQLVQKWVARPF